MGSGGGRAGCELSSGAAVSAIPETCWPPTAVWQPVSVREPACPPHQTTCCLRDPLSRPASKMRCAGVGSQGRHRSGLTTGLPTVRQSCCGSPTEYSAWFRSAAARVQRRPAAPWVGLRRRRPRSCADWFPTTWARVQRGDYPARRARWCCTSSTTHRLQIERRACPDPVLLRHAPRTLWRNPASATTMPRLGSVFRRDSGQTASVVPS